MTPLVWTHVEDGEPCPRVSLIVNDGWRCIEHGFRVETVEPTPTPQVFTDGFDRSTTPAQIWATGNFITAAYAKEVAFQKNDPLVNAFEAAQAVCMGDGQLKQIGWYCAGEHAVEGGQMAPPNLRFDDPCAHGVPVFVLVKPVEVEHPDPSYVQNLVGAMVRVTIYSDSVIYVGKFTKYQHAHRTDHGHTIWLNVRGEDLVIPWVDLRTMEEV